MGRRTRNLMWTVAAASAVLMILPVGAVAWLGVKPATGLAAPWLVPVIGDPFERWPRWFIPRPPYELAEADERVLAAAEREAQRRAGEVHRVRLLDAAGEPVAAGTAVSYELTRHAFGFGNFDGPSPQLEALWGKRRNRAYELNLWTSIHLDHEDRLDFREAEVFAAAEWERAVGVELGWHNVAWIIDKEEQDGSRELRVPGSLRDLPFAEQRERILAWVRRVAEKTDGRYDVVNVFNEPLNAWSDPYDWGDRRRRQMLADVVREFRAHNASSEIQVSIGEALTAARGDEAEWLIAWAKAEGLPVDRFALQAWCNGFFKWGQPMPVLRLAEFGDRLKTLAAYGFPLDVTEFQAPFSGSPEAFWRWDRQRQADWTEAAMRVAFGTPGVASFCYFRSRNNFMIDGGLYDGGEPAPVVDRMMGRIDSWSSAGEAEVGPGGVVELVGFAGTYDVRASGDSVGSFWRVETGSDAEARARPEPVPAPASIADLGPYVTAEHFLDASVERSGDATPPPAGVDALAAVAPIAWKHQEPRWRGLSRVGDDGGGGGFDVGGARISGFCFDAVPAGTREVVLDLELHDRGRPLAMNLFDRTRRWADAALPPGRYRVRLPVDDGSRPTLHLMARSGDYGRYRVDGERQPFARLHGAWFVGG